MSDDLEKRIAEEVAKAPALPPDRAAALRQLALRANADLLGEPAEKSA